LDFKAHAKFKLLSEKVRDKMFVVKKRYHLPLIIHKNV